MTSGSAAPPPERRPGAWVRLSVQRPIAVLMLALAVMVFGLLSLSRLPMDLMPELTYPTVTVRAEYPGAAPEDVEDRVCRRLEQSLAVVKGLRRLSSVARAESGDVILEFSWDTDLDERLQDIRERVDQTVLPDEIRRPTILRYDPSLDPVLQIGLLGEGMDLRDLRRLAEEEIERRLETLSGVAAVHVRGGREEELRIEVDEQLLRSRGLDLAELARRLEEENLDRASGLLREGNATYLVRTRNELTDLDEIARLPIRRVGDSVVRLGDVARIVDTHKEERVITRIDGQPAVKIEVYREAGANIVGIARAVKERLHGTPAQRVQLERWQREQKPSATVNLNGAPVTASATPAPEISSAPTPLPAPVSSLSVNRPDFVEAALPSNCRLEVLSDPARFIEGAIGDLRQTAFVGGALAVLVLFLFLGRVALTAIVAVSIPFAVVATFAPLYLGGITLNIMSLGGLALGIGMLVDSSIVVLEAISRRRDEGAAPAAAAMAGASEVGAAVVASTATTIAVFLPIAFVEGLAGQVFRDQALAVVYSLCAALVAALTLIPSLAGRGAASAADRDELSRSLQEARWPVRLGLLPARMVGSVVARGRALGSRVGQGPLATLQRGSTRLEDGLVHVVRWGLAHPGMVAGVGLGAVGMAVVLARGIGSELIPPVSQGEFAVLVRYPVGTPIATTAAGVAPLEKAIAALPEVAIVTTTVGVDPLDVSVRDEGEHTARLRVRLRREGSGRIETLEARTMAAVERLARASDRTHEIERPVLWSIETPIEVEVRGHDLSALRSVGRRVEEVLATLPELREVRSNLAPGHPELHLRPDREKMMRHGVTSQQLADALARKNTGVVATRLRREDRKVDVRVQVAEEQRASIPALLSLVVAQSPDGRGWRLADLLESWEIHEGPAEIRRVGQQRTALIQADVVGLDLARAAARIEQSVREQVAVPAGVVVEIGGQKREMERSRASLMGALLLAVFLVYVVMAAQFESLLQPFIILFTIPLAGVGVVLAMYFTASSFSILSFIGMIVLAGIVVNNAIVLIDLVNRLRAAGHGIHEAVIEASRRRLRPILMTTLTTVLGMVPLTGLLARVPHGPGLDWLLGSGDGAEIRAPLAWTVIGGLLSSAALTLLVVPVVYAAVGRFDRRPVRGPDPETGFE